MFWKEFPGQQVGGGSFMGFGHEISALLGGFTCLLKVLIAGRVHCLLFLHVNSQH